MSKALLLMFVASVQNAQHAVQQLLAAGSTCRCLLAMRDEAPLPFDGS